MAGRVKYTLAFALMAAAATFAAAEDSTLVLARLAFAWIAVAFGWVAVAYATGTPRLLGKRADGSRPPVATACLLPYVVLANASLALYRLTHRRDAALAEATPGVWFGRRPTAGAWPAVLDLAAEFPRARVAASGYRSLPLLDGCAVDVATLAEAVAWIDAHAARGPVLIHCALGHGRTGSVTLAWMLARGHAPTIDAGVSRLRASRPGFGLSAQQLASVRRFAATVIASDVGDG